MAGLELVSTVAALRKELTDAVVAARDERILFPVGPITVEFQVTITRTAEANAGVKFWVVEAGTGGALSREQVHTVTVTLGAPTTHSGERVQIHDGSSHKSE